MTTTHPRLPVHDSVPSGLAYRTALRRRGLQPGGAAVAQYRYRTRQGYERCDLYPVAEAVPLVRDHAAEYAAKKASKEWRARRKAAWEQEFALLEAGALERYRRAHRKAVSTFQSWAGNPKVVYLDTETTGLEGVVIDVAVVDLQGEVLFQSDIRPLLPIEEGAGGSQLQRRGPGRHARGP